MGRKLAPPWVRWVGEDGVALCHQAQTALDDLMDGLLNGDRLDQTIRKVRRTEKEVTALRERLTALQAGIDVTDLIRWIRQDPDLKKMIWALLEGDSNV